MHVVKLCTKLRYGLHLTQVRELTYLCVDNYSVRYDCYSKRLLIISSRECENRVNICTLYEIKVNLCFWHSDDGIIILYDVE